MRKLLSDAAEFITEKHRRRTWMKVVSVLACVVVFCTTYALILPAITMENTICGLEEHTHTDDCYVKVAAEEQKSLICSEESLEIHTHTASCYDEEDHLICGLADYVVHTHDASCYDEDNNLVCSLPEVKEHTHTDDCYTPGEVTVIAEGHTHTDDCYTTEKGELICTMDESEGHTHNDGCYDENGELICTLNESEGHIHVDDCYAWEKVLSCGKEEQEEQTEQAEPVLVCNKQEVILHTHSADCYDSDGHLVCGKLETKEHIHSEECFEIISDADTLTCTLPEDENHTHTDRCYGTWELVCDKEEHVHSEECYPQQNESNADETVLEEDTDPVPEEETAADTETETMEDETADSEIMVMSEDETAEETTAPLNVEKYVTDATLYYRTDKNGEWIDVENKKDIPGDADFRLEISYGNVPIADLLNANCQMTYTLPDLLRNPVANGKITSGSQEVGTITVEGNTVTLSFNRDWLNSQNTGTNPVINGDFYVEAEVDLSKVEEGKPGEIVVGGVIITIDFDDNVIAKYGDVDIVKSTPTLTEESDGDYLTYTLTVTAGEDGCPDVKVVDRFSDVTYIEKYVGVTGTSTATNDSDGPQEKGSTGSVYIGAAPTTEDPIPEAAGENVELPGTLVWVIGGMGANETRTLTYKVKLKDSYTGIQSQGNIQNTADVYSETYERESDTATFEPKADVDMKKSASEATTNDDGSLTITYTVYVKAKDDNSYTLDNVKIVDGFNTNSNQTDGKYLQYISYEESSFALYKGKTANDSDRINTPNNPHAEGSNPVIDKEETAFTYYIGELAPGEEKTLTYSVKVAPGVYVEAGNADIILKNRAEVYSDDTREDGNKWFQGYNANKTLKRKIWDRKLAGEKQEESNSITMSGKVYDATGVSVSKIETPDGSFTVPAGSYKYQVVANEAGDWDLSSASLKDSLNNQYMSFVGYIQVNAYTITDGNAPGSDLTDEDVISKLEAMSPDETVWVKIENLKSFNFKPEDIGLNRAYAYLLTYFAKPELPEGVTQVLVANEFSLEGNVIIGEGEYVINTGIKVSASVTVEGSNSFSAEKVSWYYEAPIVNSGDFKNGALYWAIKVDGDTIPNGTQFKDITNAGGGTTHYIRGTSLVGIYTGNPGKITNFKDLNELLGNRALNSLENGDYHFTKDNSFLTVKLLKDISLIDGDSLYIIVKTEPDSLPSGVRDSKTFNNKLQSSYNGTDWIDHNMASKTLYGSENVFKELGRVFTYTGTGNNITNIKGGTNQAIDTTALNGEAGTFVAWQIHVNYEGNLSGRYRVIEQIPEGMEVAYVRIWWAGSQITASEKRPVTVQLTDDGTGWTENSLTSGTNDIGNQTTYYYTKGQQVIWDVDNLIAGYEKDNYAVEYQIVCRVTDPDVLLGNQEKTFNNRVSLWTTDGNQIGDDSDGVTIKKQTLSKVGTYDPNTNGGRYPFKITLNELGEDLVKGVATITLIDELSDTLILDSSSIKVVNTKTGTEITDWNASVNGQTLKLTLPDDLPLTITYETMVNAAPGQSISIRNAAHWEGYTSPEEGIVTDDSFAYSTGGTVGADTNPTVKVIKMDQSNNQNLLQGAVFSLQEGTYTEGQFTPTESGINQSGTTDSDGTVIFGKNAGEILKYNTVYCLQETKAPEGYVLNSTPHYFAIAKKDEDGNYPTFPNGVAVWYQGAEYTYQFYNSKGEVTVKKEFKDPGNGSLDKVDGIYYFGIYDTENLEGEALQTVSISYQNGTVTPEGGEAKFTGLTLGETYYIYELDDSKQPIKDNALATVGGKSFDVTYSSGPAVTVPADGTAAVSLTVTNQVHYTALPETGGTGTLPYIFSGIALMAGTLLYIIFRRRKEGI